jgi:hypothetical protein|nr:MAG TPA: hypothetical protein [Caudoviricetes sp.]
MKNNTSVIKKLVYPIVQEAMDKRGKREFAKIFKEFIDARAEYVFSTLPLKRIPYTKADSDKLFAGIGIDINLVKDAIANTYYGDDKRYNFVAPQDPTSVLCLCIVKYFMDKHDTKMLELASVYMGFTGKFYPSLHYRSFPIEPVDYVMEWVVNNAMSQKFDIVSKGNIFGAIRSKCQVWYSTYKTKFRDFDDDDVVYIILQLRNRLGDFIKNIAKEYYKAYENKDYMVYNSDNEDSENPSEYRIAKSDSFLAEKNIDKTMAFITAGGVSYRNCKLASNTAVKTDELKSIIESITNTPNATRKIREVISIMIYTYFEQSKDKDVLNMDFIVFTTNPKPNSKDPHIARMKQIIEDWLETGSIAYRRRKQRLATRNLYFKSILMYFAMSIYEANKR